MAWSGKFLKGFSGKIVQSLQDGGHGKLEAYGLFYLGAAAIGIPAILLCIVLTARGRRIKREQIASAA